jgi:hypothetical protein
MRVMPRPVLAAVMACVALAACSLLTPDRLADAKARALYAQISTGADLSRNTDLASNLRTPAALEQLSALKAALPPGAPSAVATRSWSLKAGMGGSRAVLVHAYRYPGQTVLVQTVLTRAKDGVWQVNGFHVTFEGPKVTPPAGGAAKADEPQVT